MPGYGNQFNDEGLQVLWNASSIKMIQTCPRLYKYQMIDGFSPSEESVHLAFGSAFAEAQEHYQVLISQGHENPLREVVREAMKASADWDFDNNKKDQFTLIRTIVWYFDHFEGADLKTATINGKPAVEIKFTIDLGDGLNFLVGTLDRVVEKSGSRYILDNKTTSTGITPHYFRGYSPDNQVTAYSLAGTTIFNSPVAGVIIDVAQIAQGFSEFSRAPVLRTSAQMEEWREDALRWIKFAHECTKADHFPMNTTSCGNYGGCPFRSVCSLSPEHRDRYLRAEFKKENVE